MKKIYTFIAIVIIAIISVVTFNSTLESENFYEANVEALAMGEVNLGRMCASGTPGSQPYISCVTCKPTTLTIITMGFCK